VDYSQIKKEIEQIKERKGGKREKIDFNISTLRTKMTVTMAAAENPMKNIMSLTSKLKSPL